MTHGFLTFSGKRYELTNWEEEDDLLQDPNSYISMMEDCVNGGISWWHLMIIFFKASFVFENLDWKLVEMFFFWGIFNAGTFMQGNHNCKTQANLIMVGDYWDVLSPDTKEMICMFNFRTFLFALSKNDASEYKNIVLILASSKRFWDTTSIFISRVLER